MSYVKFANVFLKSNDKKVLKPLKWFLEAQFWEDATIEFEEVPYDNSWALFKTDTPLLW